MRTAPWKTCFRRGQLVREAQRLARSGQHTDCTTIIPQLESLEGFDTARARFEERTLRSQLNRLCAIARDTGTPKGRGA